MCDQGLAYANVMIRDHPEFSDTINWVRKNGTVGDMKKLVAVISASAQGKCKLAEVFEEIVNEHAGRGAE